MKLSLYIAVAALIVLAACESPFKNSGAYTGTPGLSFTLISNGDYAGTYRIRGGSAFEGDIFIPAVHRPDAESPWLPVTQIGAANDNTVNGAFASSVITAVYIPEGIKFIGGNAFHDCALLGGVTIPASVTEIGSNAFSGSFQLKNNLRTVTFAEGSKLEKIGYYAFAYNVVLTGITIPASVTEIGDNAFYSSSLYSSSLVGIQPESVTFEKGSQLQRIGNSAFQSSGIYSSMTIPASVTEIGRSAFGWSGVRSMIFEKGSQLQNIAVNTFQLAGITSIEIPASVTSIDERAFYFARSLRTVTFEEGSQLESIGPDAFEENLALTAIEIPAGVTSIGAGAFYDCKALRSVTFAEGSRLETIGRSAFGFCLSLEKITIPASVTEIGSGAFSANRITTPRPGIPMSLTSITFEEGSQLQSIGASAFYGCAKLTSITIPASVTSIGEGAFYRDTENDMTEPMELAAVTFAGGSRLQSIGAQAFRECRNINHIIIPAGVTSVGAGAFKEWTASQKIYIRGYANQASADAAWGAAWREGCAAAIIYQ